MLTSGVTLPISILVPAYNEEETIVENVRSMLALHYPDFEVIVVNDGSKDRTLAALIEALGLQKVERVWHADVPHAEIRGLYGSPRYPRLLVVDKVNGGKSDALNAGIDLSRFPLFCAVDADSLLDHDSLLQVMRPFIEEPEEMVAVGGRICIVNGCTVKAGQVVDIALPAEGVFHNLVFVSIRKTYPMQAYKIMHGLWGMGQMMFTKYIVVVDADVNVHNTSEVLFHLTANTDPQRDTIFTKGPADVLDHATSEIAIGSKLGFDATKKLPGEGFKRSWPPLIKMDENVKAKVEKLFNP